MIIMPSENMVMKVLSTSTIIRNVPMHLFSLTGSLWIAELPYASTDVTAELGVTLNPCPPQALELFFFQKGSVDAPS